MLFCSKCGTQVPDGTRFCPSCGAEIEAVAQAGAGPQQAYQTPPPQVSVEYTSLAQDAEVNKVWGILAYIIFLIPLFAAPKNSKFSRYHTNQGIALVICAIVISIILGIISSIVTSAYIRSAAFWYGSGWSVLTIFSILWLVYSIVMALFVILGIVHAVKGELKPLPLIGKINILKVH
jgi:uncharacterized membrane protein